MDLKQKSDNLANRMNKITEEFTKNLDTAEELVVTGNDIVDYVEEKTQDVKLYEIDNPSDQLASEIINLENLVEDFQYVRSTLRENTDNGRRVLNVITLDLIDSDEEKRASLVMSFAELNKAVALNMKLYIASYKEISGVLLDLDKIRKVESDTPKTVNNTVNINNPNGISTVDLIKQFQKK